MKKFKEGDWVFCEFTLQQIQKVEDNQVKEVCDGMFSMRGSDISDRCFDLSLNIKNISDTVKYWFDAFHKVKPSNLNYPDLNRALISKWVNMCEETDEKVLVELCKDLDAFGRKVIEMAEDVRDNYVDGVQIFR